MFCQFFGIKKAPYCYEANSLLICEVKTMNEMKKDIQ